MFTHWFKGLAVVVLMACTGNPGGQDDGDRVDGTGLDPGNDTGSNYEGTGSITVNATVLQDEIATDLTLVCGADIGENGTEFTSGITYYGTTGVPVDGVVAPETCTAEVGDQSLAATYGFPVYLDEDDFAWGAPLLTGLTTTVGTQTAESVALFKLINPGRYDCVVENYYYDAAAPDLKGAWWETDVGSPSPLVDRNGVLLVEEGDDGFIDFMEDGDYFQMVDDKITFVEFLHEGQEPQNMHVAEGSSWVDHESFGATIVWPESHVFDLSCEKR